MTRKDYQKSLIKSRTITNVAESDAKKRIFKSLEKAYKNLTAIMDLTGTDKVSYSVYSEKRAGIESVLRQMMSEYGFSTQKSILDNATIVTELYAGLNTRYAKTHGFKVDWKRSFNTVPIQALQNVVNRVWGDGLRFSNRLWNMQSHAVSGVNEILEAGISRGESAVNMAKELKQFLLDPTITDSISWTTGVSKSVTGKGTLNFNALRLAANEINNSYRESLVIANAKNPIMLGTKWNLSNAHVVPDICDIWAKVDQYGIGAGVFPEGRAPIDHPGGHCFITEVLRNPAEWDMPKQQYYPIDLSEKALLAPLGNDISQGYRTAALKMFNSTNKLINQPLYRAAA